MSTLPSVELGVLGPLQVRRDGAPVAIPGAKPRAILSMLGLHGGSVVAADTLVELLWGEHPPRTAAKALQTHISSLRRTLGDGFVLTAGAGWTLTEARVDAARYKAAARLARDAAAAGDTGQAVARFEEALALWRGIPELPDGRRGTSEKTRWIEGHAALVEDRADALLATGRAAEIIGELEAAVAEAPLRERRWGQLMLALYRAGRQGEALAAYQRARALLAEELGVDPGPDLRRLEAAIVAQDPALEAPAAQQLSSVTRAVTFLLTDIEGSTAAWEADAQAMAVALARHDELVEQVVTSRGGRLIKTRGEGDATFSVFERPSAAAAAAIELQEAIVSEPWALREPMRVRVALHTGEVELRDGDYFGRAVNRAARLRSLASGGQILCSGATAELVIDSLPDDVAIADLGTRQLRNLARPEHVFELRLQAADEPRQADETDAPLPRPSLPAVLAGRGPFVGRGRELEQLSSAWQASLAGGANAMLIAGEPGVGKTRLAGEWARQAYDLGALVIYGRCDEDLGAPYQPFAEALRSLVPCLGGGGLRGLRGVEALLTLVPGLTDVLPDLAAPTRADPDTERYALFDAVVALLTMASASAPVVLILDDLHWAAKPTLLLLRHLLRFGEHARVQIIGTYRSTDLDRSHPLAAMLADLHRDGTANRLALSGLDEDDVTAYVAEVGYNDEELARALASLTGGNPFFLIEALRHVDESGGRWDQSTLPQGVREAVSRRLSRLPAEANKALAAAAVVGSRFALELVERVVGDDLVDAFDEACKAGIVIEEPGGRYRFNHALVRQSLLAELPSVRRMRLHQRIAATLENEPGPDDERLAELAYHYFECAWAGNAAKAVFYCRRAADQAMARLAYEGAADLYDRALHALEEIDDELPDRDNQTAELLIARCEALLAAGDVTSAASAVSQLQTATVDSAQLAAWATCFDGQLSMLTHPERLDDVEAAVGAAAGKLAELGDAAGEAKAHTVRAGCLARLGRIGDCEIALDEALTAARRAREHRRVNAVLAQAPLAALWGPNPVPRAGGRCLDVVRLLRITTDSPAVEATSTRCQAVLEAFRGRAAAARRMIDSARRTVTELGLRHALLEVEQFAGIVELVVDEPAAAEQYLRKAYNGFRRMGLDADTAETAALLGRTCLALDRDAEADELCAESERLAGHALKASIAWRTLRARLLSRRGDHDQARRVAEQAVALAERTDALVDHGDACLGLATALGAAGDVAGARSAAERAVELYERKGAVALAERARAVLGERAVPPLPTPPEARVVELDNACVRAGERVTAAINREAWEEFEQLFAPDGFIESRRKIVGFGQIDVPPGEFPNVNRRVLETVPMRVTQMVIAVRGERLALARLVIGADDVSPGAPQDEFLLLYGIDEDGRICLQIWFDLEDIKAAINELDAAHARFEEEPSPARQLENTAARVFEEEWSHFAARDWDALADTVADDYVGIDHRRVVSAETQLSRADVVRDLQAAAEVGFSISMVSAVAIRGERLVLARVRAVGSDPAAVENDALNVVEIDADGRIANVVTFDLEDIDTALAQLDARYLAGEGALYGATWAVVTRAYAALNRFELPPTTSDFVSIDHRRGATFAPGDLIAYVRAAWNLAQDGTTYIETVHRLTDVGALVTHVTRGTSREGFEAEWRENFLLTVEGDVINCCELFDEDDLGAAIARFDQLSRPASHLENAATRAYERVYSHFAARDWNALAAAAADDYSIDDRRRVVNAGMRHGRDAAMEEVRAIADVGFGTMTILGVMATRGARLALIRTRISGSDPDAIQNDALNVVEVDVDEHVAAIVVFDLEDFDAALAELDRRYLAGEAATYSRTWSLVTEAIAVLNQRRIPKTTSDWASIDHRRLAPIGTGDLGAYLRAAWELSSQSGIYVEAVHRLGSLGAVITHVATGTSPDGFDAEWRVTDVVIFDGDRISRSELFDDSDVAAALARFEKLQPKELRLENAASRLYERFKVCYAAREWSAVRQLLADTVLSDDRRHPINSGIRYGPDALIAEISALAEVGIELTTEVIATRGEHLVLSRIRTFGRDQGPDGFQSVDLDVLEVGPDGRFVARVVFNDDDFDAAIAELDARYLAGEALAQRNVLRSVMDTIEELNRHEPGPMLERITFINHRRVPFGSAEHYGRAIEELWTLVPDARYWTKAVHALDGRGLVSTLVIQGTDAHGNELQWGRTFVFLSDGPRAEVYEEDDVDAALASFDQLRQPAPHLENAASQAYERFRAYFAARDWAAMAELLAPDTTVDDHRRVVNAETLRGREVEIANMRVFADIGVTTSTAEVIATRGERLVLCRTRISGEDHHPFGGFSIDMLIIVETSADERILARVAYDPDDMDAAFAELDARYLAGEAAAHARVWSVVAQSFASINRREMPATTPDWVNTDHRRGTSIAPGEMAALMAAAWSSTSDLRCFVESVHRLTDLGVVITHAAHETSQDGFHAEWRVISVITVEGDLISRTEVFDEAQIDAAIALFDRLSRPTPRLENAASRAYDRLAAHFAARDWNATANAMTQNMIDDDRRRMVNAGIRRGRDVEVANSQATAGIGGEKILSAVIATRGERLALCRSSIIGRGEQSGAFHIEFLSVLETDVDERLAAHVAFDLDDFDSAVEELDARYIAGEAAAHARTWSAITGAYAAINRHQLPSMTMDFADIDHRRGAAWAPGELVEFLRSALDQTPDLTIRIAAVHRLNSQGAVVTHSATGTSPDGFDAEWREILFLIVDGDMLKHCEVFDETELDAALARFDELHTRPHRLDNAASQVSERFWDCLTTRDWTAMTEVLAENAVSRDNRRVVNSGVLRGRDINIANLRAVAEVGFERLVSTILAIRGQRLALTRIWSSAKGCEPGEISADMVGVVEIDRDNRMVVHSIFDADDFDAAVAELEARYIAGEAAEYAHTWSLVAQGHAQFNRQELPTMMPDVVYIDHRRGVTIEGADLATTVRAGWDLLPRVHVYVEAVHRLTDRGAVATQVVKGTSQEGFDAEWQMITIFSFEGDRLSRYEVFDEAELDAALARFDELSRPTRRLENAASRAEDQLFARSAAGDWAAIAEILADDSLVEDRRRVVNVGVWDGRDAVMANMRALAEGLVQVTLTVIATRGERLALIRIRSFEPDSQRGEFVIELLGIAETDTDGQIAAHVFFDVDDADAAFDELDARYVAGEAAAHARTWSIIAGSYAAMNRRELFPTTPDWVNVDHRRPGIFEEGGLNASLLSLWQLTTDLTFRIEAVHRLTDLGMVCSHVAHGISQDGFDAEWRGIEVQTVDGHLINRCEIFDEADLDAALARFEELTRGD
ncbi:AAA family ATPase [Mycobacterium seoulense]|nr:AAA family ATPase [Mycobacterium seoulense]